MENKLINFSTQMNPEVIADQIVKAINDGNLNPLEAAVGLKKLEKVIEQVFSSSKGDKDARDARDKETQLFAPKGKAQAFGATVEYVATSTSYDYSLCGHVEYDELARIATIVKARMDKIQKELVKLAPSTEENPNEVVIRTVPVLKEMPYGEVVNLEPPTKRVTMGTKITV